MFIVLQNHVIKCLYRVMNQKERDSARTPNSERSARTPNSERSARTPNSERSDKTDKSESENMMCGTREDLLQGYRLYFLGIFSVPPRAFTFSILGIV